MVKYAVLNLNGIIKQTDELHKQLNSWMQLCLLFRDLYFALTSFVL